METLSSFQQMGGEIMIRLKVEAALCWTLVAVALWHHRPDLAQPLAMLGTTLVSALVNQSNRKDRGKRPRSSALLPPVKDPPDELPLRHLQGVVGRQEGPVIVRGFA